MTRTFLARSRALAAIAVLGALAAVFAATPLYAQQYPEKPITIVVPFPPGGSTDVLARQIAEQISKPLGQPVVVENRPGAGGTVGANYVVRAKPDGYTLLMGVTGSNAISAVLRDDLPYNPLTDFSPVSLVISAPLVVVVNADNEIKSLADYIKFAKAKPETVTHGSPGVGTSMHLTGELFGLESGTKLVHVPYKGSAAALQDLLGGQVMSMFGDVLVTAEHIKAGKVRPLAVTSSKRHFLLPDVQTVAESGLKDFEALSWQGLFAPAGTPKPILDRLYKEVAAALKTESLQKFFQERGFMVESRSPSDSQAFIEGEVKKWGRVVKEAGLKVK